jgi:hypothetical protein
MRPWALISVLCSVANCFGAQTDSTAHTKNAVHLEVLGSGGLGSLNYERVLLRRSHLTMGGRLGISSIHLTDFTKHFNPDVVLPIGLFLCYGANLKAEVAGGPAITSIVYPDAEDFEPARRSEVHGWMTIGARFQQHERGLVYRLAYTPIIEFGAWRHWAGASIGYAF